MDSGKLLLNMSTWVKHRSRKQVNLAPFINKNQNITLFPLPLRGEKKYDFAYIFSFLATAAAVVALAVGTLVMIQLCQQKQAGLNLSSDKRDGTQQITWLQINRSCSVRSFAARVISQMHSPQRAIWAENVFSRDLITLKIPWKAYPRESRGWSCRCGSSS